jgi:uncharacterized protein (DUF433 family)
MAPSKLVATWPRGTPAGSDQMYIEPMKSTRHRSLAARAEASISVDPAVMRGVPVFAGTRVPIANVLASKRAGFNLEQLQEAYAFLTAELIEDAETYQSCHLNGCSAREKPESAAVVSRRRLLSQDVIDLPKADQ